MAQDFAISQVQNPLSKADAREGLSNIRLVYAGATTLSISILDGDTTPINGNEFHGAALSPILNTTDHTITSAAADSGAGMGASTMYYIYWCLAGFAANAMAASTTKPSLNSSNVPVLGTSGNAASCLFIGWAYTNGSTQFSDDEANRLVVSYYNRRRTRIRLRPGYSDGNTQSNILVNTTNWTKVNGGTGDVAQWIDCYGQQITGAANYCLNTASTAVIGAGVGDTGATRIDAATNFPNGAAVSSSSAVPFVIAGAVSSVTGTAVLNTVAMLARTGATAQRFNCDEARNGATADPPLTYLMAECWN
jgi:hypothetical protein